MNCLCTSWLRKGLTSMLKTALEGLYCGIQLKESMKKIMQLLVEKEADMTAKNDDEKTAGNGYKVVVILLIENGADVTAKDEDGRTALQGAAEKGQEEVVLFEGVGVLAERGEEGGELIPTSFLFCCFPLYSVGEAGGFRGAVFLEYNVFMIAFPHPRCGIIYF